MNYIEKFLSFVKSVLSEPDGTGSSTRVCMIALVFFVIGVGTTFVLRMHTPVTPSDVCNIFTSLGVFIVTTCGPLYAINKGAEAWKHTSDQADRGEDRR